MRLGQADVLAWNRWSLRLQSLAEFFGLPPQLGLEPATHTSEALAERYLNGMFFWFRFLFLKSYGSGSGSKNVGKNLAFLLSELFYKEKVYKFQQIHCKM
jgi:hypothetical protein